MIDPHNVINYNRKDSELEEFIIFCICVAGKKASTIAPRVDRVVNTHKLGVGPFLLYQLKTVGIGCYRQKANTIREVWRRKLNLRTCSLSELESIKGIGPKTARFFLMSSRPGCRYAALDTHVGKYLSEVLELDGVVKNPTGKKYLELEKIFLASVPDGISPAEHDLSIWNFYTKNSDKKPIYNKNFVSTAVLLGYTTSIVQ